MKPLATSILCFAIFFAGISAIATWKYVTQQTKAMESAYFECQYWNRIHKEFNTPLTSAKAREAEDLCIERFGMRSDQLPLSETTKAAIIVRATLP